MSYILEALRKSSEERRKLKQQQDEPVLHQYKPPARSAPRPNLLLIILTLCVLTASLGAGVVWYRFNNQPVDVSVEQAQTGAPKPTATAPKPDPLAQTDPKILPNRPADPQVPDQIDTEAVTSPASPMLPLLEELPLATQAAIPEMKFSGHVYSQNPDLRMILVNTSIVREGQAITPELQLEEITDSGLIMNYRQTRFRVELF